MNKIKNIIAATAILLTATAGAQELESAYFVKGYAYRHEMNPAIANDDSYISIPMLGNINFEMGGTLGLKDLLYNVNGRTVTYINPDVPESAVLGNIKDENKLGMNMKIQLLSVGFKAPEGYNSIQLNVRAGTHAIIPGSIIKATKEGLTNRTYDLSGLNLSANTYAELAFGHSHQIGEHLSVGAKAKLLIGLAGADLKVNKALLNLGEDSYKATVNADMYVHSKNVKFEHEKNGTTGHQYVNGIDNIEIGQNGIGVAFDLGAVYKLNDNWSFSASVSDLGVIKYKNSFMVSTGGDRNFDTNKYVFNFDNDAPNNFDDEMNRLTDGLAELYQLDDKGKAEAHKMSLGSTVHVGVEYTLPTYRNLTFGLLSTTRTGDYSWSEYRISANVMPLKWFSASLSAVAGTFGLGFGGVLNIHTRVVNLFVAMDKMIGSVSKQFVPLNSNASFSAGLSFAL